MLKKPQNIYMPIDKFQAKVFKNKDTMSRGQWVENFALSLAGESEDDFANELITEAQVSMYKEKLRKWKSYTKNNLINENAGAVPTEKEIFDRCCEIFGDEFIEACDLVDSNTKKRRKNIADSLGITAGAPTREDGVKPEGVRIAPKAESGTPAKPSLAYSGKNGLVRLTDDEYALLLQELGNKRKADRLIDDLDYKLAEGATFRQPHLHVLTHWQSYREDKAAEAAEMAKSRAAANAEAFGNVDRRTPFQKNQDELHQLYVMTSEKLKELK